MQMQTIELKYARGREHCTRTALNSKQRSEPRWKGTNEYSMRKPSCATDESVLRCSASTLLCELICRGITPPQYLYRPHNTLEAIFWHVQSRVPASFAYELNAATSCALLFVQHTVPAHQRAAAVPEFERVVRAAEVRLELEREHSQAHDVAARRPHQPAAVEPVRVRQRVARRLDQAARRRQVPATICAQ